MGERHQIIQRWVEFDSALRDELVKIRATKTHIEPAPYLRHESYRGPTLVPAGMAANTSNSLLDWEKTLDETRWKALEELATGHYFDLELLITYAYKLLILQRWESIRSADKEALLEQALQHWNGGIDDSN